LGRTGEHRNAMLANMVCSLIEKTRITTTLAKAKAARVVAEKMVTLGKKGTLHHRRLAAARLRAPQRKFFHGTNTTPGKGSGANAVKGKDLREAWRKEHDVVRILFDEIAPKFQDRMGGYTRIVKIAGARKGDAAQMAILMWVDESLEEKAKAKSSTAAKPKPAQEKAEDSPETPEASATEEEAPAAEEAPATTADDDPGPLDRSIGCRIGHGSRDRAVGKCIECRIGGRGRTVLDGDHCLWQDNGAQIKAMHKNTPIG
jgi:large subunit ribosomal protein L17